MTEKIIRMRVPENVYKKFKILCAELDLSLPKQNLMLIENFLQIQEDNLNLKKHLKKIMKE